MQKTQMCYDTIYIIQSTTTRVQKSVICVEALLTPECY